MPSSDPSHPSVIQRLSIALRQRTSLGQLLTLAMLPFALAAAVIFYGVYQSEREQLEQEALQTARALLLAMDSELATATSVAQTLAESGMLERQDFAGFHERAREVLRTTGAGHNFVLSDLAGRQLLNTAAPYPGSLPSHGRPEQVTRVVAGGRPAISDLYFGALLQRPLVSVDVPVTIDAKTRYVLSIGLLPEHFSRLLAEQKLPPGWIAALLDSQGTVVARNLDPGRMVGKKATPDLLAQLQQQSEGRLASRTLEGIPSFLAFSQSRISGWTMAVGMSRDILYANLSRHLTLVGLALLGLLVGAALLVWIIGRYVGQSLARIGSATEAAGLGDRNARVPSFGLREIGHLAEQFNAMQEARTRAEASLRQSEAELKEAQRIAHIGYWLLDLASGQVTWSDELFHMFGADPADSPPPFPEHRKWYTPESWLRLAEAADAACRHGVPYELELEICRSDDRRGWIWVRGEAKRDEAGNIVGLRGIVQDITERKTAAVELEAYRHHLEALVAERTRELEAARDAADAASRAKTAFLANMSHEIRTPLNAITGMSYLIRRAGLVPEQEARMAKIDTAANHLLQIINAVLDLARIENGKLALEDIDVSLDGVIANVASMLSEQARAANLQLITEPPPATGPLAGDPTRLQQALLNFASNAVKFTEAGSVTLRARIDAEDEAGVLVRFEVEDTGVGVAPEVAERLFAPFEQADNSTTRNYGGSGLGLAITRKLAVLMGGDAGFSSKPGAGSLFWFTARLRRMKASALPVSGAAAPASAEAVVRRDYAGSTILLVEDDLVCREFAQELLEDACLVVDTAVDGEEAVALAGQRHYDLILMDMQMPRLDGIEATRQIRRLPQHGDLPIIAMTANAFAEDRARCLAAGMNDFIAKPVDPEILFQTLLRHLAHGDGDEGNNAPGERR